MEVPSLVVPWISEQKPDEAQGSAEFDSIWSERYFFVQWVPACSHSMQGQDSFLSKDMAETSSYSLLWHGSVKVTRAFISLLQLYKNQSLPLEQWHPRFLHALWKVYAASNRREKNWCIKWFFLRASRNYIHMAAIFHASAAMCFPWAHLFMYKELSLNHWDSVA